VFEPLQQPAARPRLRVSAYIPCYNAERTIGQAIASLFAQWRKPDEVMVVDDGSTDRSLNIALTYPVKVWRHKGNRGLAAARNTALHGASGDLIASIDADCFAEPRWLGRLVKRIEADSAVIGAGGATVEEHQRSLADRWRAQHLRQHLGSTPLDNVEFLFGANTVFRRASLLAIGGYNASLRTNGEDRDLCRRLLERHRQSRLLYDPKAVVQHLREDTIGSVIETKWRYLHFPAGVLHPYDDRVDALRRTADLMGQLWRKDLMSDVQARRVDLAGITLMALTAIPVFQFRAYRRRRRELRQAQAPAATPKSY